MHSCIKILCLVGWGVEIRSSCVWGKAGTPSPRIFVDVPTRFLFVFVCFFFRVYVADVAWTNKMNLDEDVFG